jgi:hypothetical protein
MSVGPVTTKIRPPLNVSMPKDFDKPAKGGPVKVGRYLEPVLVADVKHERSLSNPRRLGPQLDLQELLIFGFAREIRDCYGARKPASPLVESRRRNAKASCERAHA